MLHIKFQLQKPAKSCTSQILSFDEVKLEHFGPSNHHNVIFSLIMAMNFFGPIPYYVRPLIDPILSSFLVRNIIPLREAIVKAMIEHLSGEI